jgi:dihydroneopterin aldolase
LTDPFATPFPASGDWSRALLDGVEVEVRCGLHPWERHPQRPNRLLVDVEMYSAWPVPTQAADGFPLPGYVDYDRVRDFILAWRDRPDHVELLETLLGELSDFVFEDAAVEACRVRIVKPDIFAATRAVGVEIFRRRPAA